VGAGNRSLDRAGRQHDRLGRDLIGPVDRDAARADQRAGALDQVDLVLLEQTGDPAGQRRDDLQAASGDSRIVDLRRSDLDPVVTGLADLGQHVGDAEDRLGRDAGVVQAPATDPVRLDHGGLHSQLRGPDGGDITARAGADHDCVI
jgi:hypothetical protein